MKKRVFLLSQLLPVRRCLHQEELIRLLPVQLFPVRQCLSQLLPVRWHLHQEELIRLFPVRLLPVRRCLYQEELIRLLPVRQYLSPEVSIPPHPVR